MTRQLTPAAPRLRLVSLRIGGAGRSAWTRRIFPASVLVGPDGRARKVIVGEFDWNGPQAGSLIAALLPR